MDLLLLVLPAELLPLAIAVGGLAVVAGLLRLRRALRLLALVLLAPVVAYVAGSAIAELPLWLVLTAAVVLFLQFVRMALAVFIGREGAGHVLGSLVVSVAHAVLRTIALAVRVVLRLIGHLAPALVAVVRGGRLRRSIREG